MYKKEIDDYFDAPNRRKEWVEAVSRLVRIRSVRSESKPGMPYGEGPAEALAEGLRLCEEFGLSTRNVDNYVGTADLNQQETLLHILGHLDVVGEGTGWSCDPYAPVERDGMLVGRGVADDKGPVVAALFAMRCVKELGLPLRHNVRLILGTDEESGSSDIAYYYAREPYAPHTFTPDADFPVIHIEKGHYHPDFGAAWEESSALPRVTELRGGFRSNVVPPEASARVLGLEPELVKRVCAEAADQTGTTVTVTAREDGLAIFCAGKNAHAANPDEGNNAIAALLTVLASLPLADCESTKAVKAMHALFPHGDNRGKALGIAQEDVESGALTLNLALMTLTETGFSAKFDVRFPLCATEENCKRMAERTFTKHGISIIGDGEMTAVHCVEADSPFVQTLLACYGAYTGDVGAKPIAIGGGTYVHDIPGGVAFGCTMPGFDPQMHGPDERICVDDLMTACKIFTQAIVELCG